MSIRRDKHLPQATPTPTNQGQPPPGTAQSQGQPPGSLPTTTIGLLKLVFKSAFQNLPKMIRGLAIRGLITFVLVFAFNFYVVAVKNEGFGVSISPDSPWYPLLSIGENENAFAALSFLAFFIVSMIWGRIRGHGLKPLLKEIGGVPAWTAQSIRETGRSTLPVLTITGGLLLLSSLLIHNRYLYLVFAVGLFFAYAAREADFSLIFFRTLWTDLKRVFGRGHLAQPTPAGAIALAMLGLMLASILLVFLPMQPVLPVILGVLSIAAGILVAVRKVKPQTAVFILGLATVLVLLGETGVRVLADDGGWQEGGGTVGSYIRSPGVGGVLATGVKPGLLGAAGSLLGGIFSAGYNAVSSAASTAYNAGAYVGEKVVSGVKTVAQAAVDTGRAAVQLGSDLVNPEIIKDTLTNIKNEIVDTAGQIKDGVVEIAGEVKQAAVDVYNDPQILVDTVKGTAGDIKDGVVTAVTETAQAVKDVYNDPQILVDTIKGSAETVKNVVTGIGQAIYTTVIDPEKALDFVKDALGTKDFANSWDPNRNLITRIGDVLTGTVKLGSTLATAGQAGAAIKSGVKVAGGLVDDVVRGVTSGGRKAGGFIDDLVRGAGGQKAAGAGTKKIVTTAPGKLPVSPGTGYTPTGRPVNLGGITDKSKIAIQNVADDMGVQIHTRPVTGAAKDLLESGRALPKPLEIKAKTLNKLDELIGGPRGQEGVSAIFKPTKPPESVLRNMPSDVRKELEKRIADRAKEYTKYIDEIKANPNFKIVDNVILDRKTGLPFTGDVDIYDITSFDGKPLTEKVKQMVWQKLESIQPANVKHGNLTSWNPSDPHFDPEAYIKMILDGKSGGKGVTTFNPLNNPTHNFAN
jgi:hypothetical protein